MTAGQAPAPVPEAAVPPPSTIAVAPPPAATPAPGATASTSATPATSGRKRAARNGPGPSTEQVMHLIAVRNKLTPREVAIADGAVARMPDDVRAQWMDELCALSVDDAAEVVRRILREAKARPPAGGG